MSRNGDHGLAQPVHLVVGALALQVPSDVLSLGLSLDLPYRLSTLDKLSLSHTRHTSQGLGRRFCDLSYYNRWRQVAVRGPHGCRPGQSASALADGSTRIESAPIVAERNWGLLNGQAGATT